MEQTTAKRTQMQPQKSFQKEEPVIVVQDVRKHFKVYLDKGQSFKERILFRNRRRYENRRVLDGISFTVRRGEAVGLIGHNGCGKSTTLKLLTRILYPDSGAITIKGRVSSLIELGAGFHPDMSGRENIYTNASIFGLTKKEIDQRLDTIIAFSELEAFIDNPVRTYSSGMYMRLAFSVAINVDADVLLIDEILSVGDANFQAKCFRKLQEIKAKGTTIVIVSHALGQIEQICERSIWIHEGKIRAEGPAREVDLEYMEFMGQQMQAAARKEQLAQSAESTVEETADAPEEPTQSGEKKRWGNGRARIRQIRLTDADGTLQTVFRTGETVQITLRYQVKQPVENPVFGVGIFRQDGVQCYGTNTRIDQVSVAPLTADGTVTLTLSPLYLLPGTYTIDLAVESGDGIPVDYWKEAAVIQMTAAVGDVGVMRIPHQWSLTE